MSFEWIHFVSGHIILGHYIAFYRFELYNDTNININQ